MKQFFFTMAKSVLENKHILNNVKHILRLISTHISIQIADRKKPES